MVNNIRTIIWDWNGTLLNDISLCYSLFLDEMKKAHLPPLTLEEYRNQLSFPIEQFYFHLGLVTCSEEYQDLAKHFNKNYRRRLSECSLHEGVEKLLSQCLSRGVDNIIISAYRERDLLEVVEEYGIINYFSTVHGMSDQLAHSKVALAQEVMAQRGIDPALTLFVGDTTHDYEVAQELGVKPILVNSGHNSRGRLEMCKEATIIDRLVELNDILML